MNPQWKKFMRGVGGLFPPYAKKHGVQYLDGTIIENNGWFLEDKLGKEIRTIETGDCYSNPLLSGFVTIPNNGESLFGKSVEIETYLNYSKYSNAIFGYCDNLGARFDIAFEKTNLSIFQYNGSTRSDIYHCGSFIPGNYYKIRIEWMDESTLPVIYINDVICSNVLFVGSVGLRPIEERNITKLFHLSLPTNASYMGNGKIANVKIFNTNGEIEHFYKCDETTGDTCYDYIDTNPINGQIIGADASFHVEDVHFATDKNKYGYTANNGVELTPTINPDGTRNKVDPLGNDITMKRNKLNCEIRGTSYGTFNGTDNYIPTDIMLNDDNWSIYSLFEINVTNEAYNGNITNKNGSSRGIALNQYNNQIRIYIAESGGSRYLPFSTTRFNVDDIVETLLTYNRNTEQLILYESINHNTPVITTYENIDIDIFTLPLAIGAFYTVGFGTSYSDFYNFNIWTNQTVEWEDRNNCSGSDCYNFNFSEGNDNQIYNKVSGQSYSITGDLTNFWQNSGDNKIRPNNLLDGFDLWQNDTTSEYLRVPFDINGNSIKTDGDAITGYTWISKNPPAKGLNNSENYLVQPICPDLILPDILENHYWFNTNNVPNHIGYKDRHAIVYDNDPKYITFMDISKANVISKIAVYDKKMNSVEEFNKITNFFNDPVLRDERGIPLTDIAGEYIETSNVNVKNKILLDDEGSPILTENNEPITTE